MNAGERDRVERTDWDVIVVGTGMGGASVGYALARAGKRVLYCERGRAHWRRGSIQGQYAEEYLAASRSRINEREAFLRAGRWEASIRNTAGKGGRVFVPFMGSGTGGSSTINGTVMQRFFAEDFTPRSNYPEAGEANLPESWPFDYAELRPYYRMAEHMHAVRGQLDPLRLDELDPLPSRPPIPRSTFARELSAYLTAQDMHPYQPPLGCDLLDGCSGCQGTICPKQCKNDSAKVCLVPAIEHYGAALLDECHVVRIDADRRHATKVHCMWKGGHLTLRGHTIILAAGALETPRILLRSRSAAWPEGLANESGLVGRNLTRNYYDLYFLFPERGQEIGNGLKELYFNDFYTRPGGKLGIVQDFGPLPPPEAIMHGLEHTLAANRLTWVTPLFRALRPCLVNGLRRKGAGVVALVSTMEDMPYVDNRVTVSDDGGIGIEYRVRAHDLRRIRTFRKILMSLLRPFGVRLFRQAEQNNNFIALAAGTCRAGTDPRTSVVDATNRAHQLDNLYIVDSSFFPSNPGLNSGLTVVANGLRVADAILARRPNEDLNFFDDLRLAEAD